MNHENDNLTSGEGDPQLSSLYRELATEQAPATLDSAVLREAAHNKSKQRVWRSMWFRPLAFVATVGLCVAIVLEIDRSSQVGVPTDFITSEEPPKNDPVYRNEPKQAPIAGGNASHQPQKSSAADSPTEDISVQTMIQAEEISRDDVKKESDAHADAMAKSQPRLDAPEERAAELRSAGRAVPAVPASRTSELDQAAANGARRMRLVEPDMAAAPAAAAESQLSMEVVSAFSMADDAAPAQCDEQARSESASWQQCIDVLSENGETEMADRELTLFREAFPEHVPAN